jgi:hypothetical protein
MAFSCMKNKEEESPSTQTLFQAFRHCPQPSEFVFRPYTICIPLFWPHMTYISLLCLCLTSHMLCFVTFFTFSCTSSDSLWNHLQSWTPKVRLFYSERIACGNLLIFTESSLHCKKELIYHFFRFFPIFPGVAKI